jgi:hypothetical protein
MRRFSIRTLMALIVISAVGLAALRNANELLAELMILGAVDALGIAVLGAKGAGGGDSVSIVKQSLLERLVTWKRHCHFRVVAWRTSAVLRRAG